MPPECTAVLQVEVELLTGRAHQIRGQLSALGFPLCGDAMYGGVANLPLEKKNSDCEGCSDGYMNSENLALQCSELQFLDPDYVVNKKGDKNAVRSKRLNKFRIESAWWSQHIQQYYDGFMNGNTTNNHDLETAKKIKVSVRNKNTEEKIENTMKHKKKSIQSIQLSPGKHKYVVVKATHPDLEKPEWFVKTASPSECGGPFHADVAKGLVNDLNGAGYDTIIFGGGRIDFDLYQKHAHVYGFSYAFGKGDHEFVSLLIEQEGISTSFDNSDTLY